MARKKLDLQAYQQGILDRLKSLAQSQRAPAASRLGVSIGGENWLLALGDISEVLPLPEVMRVPLTQAWFMGMANVRGNLYALTDLAAYLGHAPAAATADSRILLAHGRFGINAGLLVDRVVGLRHLEDMQIEPGAELKAPWQHGRYIDASQQSWGEIDLGVLLNQNAFMQVAA